MRGHVQVGTGARTTVVSSQGGHSVYDNMVTVLGSRAAEAMQPLEASTPSGACISGCAADLTCLLSAVAQGTWERPVIHKDMLQKRMDRASASGRRAGTACWQ